MDEGEDRIEADIEISPGLREKIDAICKERGITFEEAIDSALKQWIARESAS